MEEGGTERGGSEGKGFKEKEGRRRRVKGGIGRGRGEGRREKVGEKVNRI